jgi:hypothetical protein
MLAAARLAISACIAGPAHTPPHSRVGGHPRPLSPTLPYPAFTQFCFSNVLYWLCLEILNMSYFSGRRPADAVTPHSGYHQCPADHREHPQVRPALQPHHLCARRAHALRQPAAASLLAGVGGLCAGRVRHRGAGGVVPTHGAKGGWLVPPAPPPPPPPSHTRAHTHARTHAQRKKFGVFSF